MHRLDENSDARHEGSEKTVRVERSSRSERSRNVCGGPSTPDRSPGQASALRAYAQGERTGDLVNRKGNL
jgi:hypothetical protein